MGRHRNSHGCSVASAAFAKRKGRLSIAEQTMLQGVDHSIPPEKAAEKLAPLMQRSESAVKAGIIKARQDFQNRAGEYVALHLQAARKAASMGNSKPAEYALERLEVDGERIVTPPAASQEHSGIKIILANVRLGGTRDKSTDLEIIDAEAS